MRRWSALLLALAFFFSFSAPGFCAFFCEREAQVSVSSCHEMAHEKPTAPEAKGPGFGKRPVSCPVLLCLERASWSRAVVAATAKASYEQGPALGVRLAHLFHFRESKVRNPKIDSPPPLPQSMPLYLKKRTLLV
jgi:hypothetical protein